MKPTIYRSFKPRPAPKTNDPVTLDRFWEFWRGMLASHAANNHRLNPGGEQFRPSTPPRHRIAPKGFYYNGRGRLVPAR